MILNDNMKETKRSLMEEQAYYLVVDGNLVIKTGSLR
jgi:hypothetical protein